MSENFYNRRQRFRRFQNIGYIKVGTTHDFQSAGGIGRKVNPDVSVLIACLRMLITSYWKGRRGYNPCTPTTFVSPFFNPFIDPCWMERNQNKGVLPSPKALKDSLKYRLFLPYRMPGNRNSTFIPRRNNTGVPLRVFRDHPVRTASQIKQNSSKPSRIPLSSNSSKSSTKKRHWIRSPIKPSQGTAK